jgi:NADP-dependent 3-hydroxy acid dehydrogenase YdfG
LSLAPRYHASGDEHGEDNHLVPVLGGQIAVVTGASSGIGRAIALGLADEGAAVCLVGRNLERLQTVSGSGRRSWERFSLHNADLTLDRDIRLLAARLQEQFGAIDILVHSAGVIALGTVEHASVEDFDTQYRINVRAPFALTQLLLPMLKSRRGQIVFINSSAGLHAKGSLAGYSASKHALKALADSLRAEINEIGLRVISVYPGRTATPMQSRIFEAEGRIYRPELLMQPEDVSRVVVEALKLPRTAEITDIMVRPANKT